MKNILLIAQNIREIERKYFEDLGYNIVFIPKSKNVYEEISSHSDIFCTKIRDKLILEPSLFEYYLKQKDIFNMISNKINVIKGSAIVGQKYPSSVPYNICVTENYAIHNFKYTDEIVNGIIDEYNLKKININQGYSNCSIAQVDENSCIVTDESIANELNKEGIDVLYISYNDIDIKLINSEKYSNMKGFIGGATAKIGNKFIVFGSLDNITKSSRTKLYKFLQLKNIELIDFKGLHIVDYGGAIVI